MDDVKQSSGVGDEEEYQPRNEERPAKVPRFTDRSDRAFLINVYDLAETSCRNDGPYAVNADPTSAPNKARQEGGAEAKQEEEVCREEPAGDEGHPGAEAAEPAASQPHLHPHPHAPTRATATTHEPGCSYPRAYPEPSPTQPFADCHVPPPPARPEDSEEAAALYQCLYEAELAARLAVTRQLEAEQKMHELQHKLQEAENRELMLKIRILKMQAKMSSSPDLDPDVSNNNANNNNSNYNNINEEAPSPSLGVSASQGTTSSSSSSCLGGASSSQSNSSNSQSSNSSSSSLKHPANSPARTRPIVKPELSEEEGPAAVKVKPEFGEQMPAFRRRGKGGQDQIHPALQAALVELDWNVAGQYLGADNINKRAVSSRELEWVGKYSKETVTISPGAPLPVVILSAAYAHQAWNKRDREDMDRALALLRSLLSSTDLTGLDLNTRVKLSVRSVQSCHGNTTWHKSGGLLELLETMAEHQHYRYLADFRNLAEELQARVLGNHDNFEMSGPGHVRGTTVGSRARSSSRFSASRTYLASVLAAEATSSGSGGGGGGGGSSSGNATARGSTSSGCATSSSSTCRRR